MQRTSNCDTGPAVTNSADADRLPLIDEHLQAQWREDLNTDDIRQILAHARLEAAKSLAMIKDAAARHDLAALKRSAHKLKGMVGNLGAVRLVALLRGIELGAAGGEGSPIAVARLEPVVCDTLLAFEGNV